MGKFGFFIIIFCIISTLGVLIVLIFLRTTTRPLPPKNTPSPTSSPNPTPSFPTTTTIESSGIEIKNPFMGAAEFTTQGDALTVKATTHRIVYLKQFDEFIITIEKEPFEENMRIAEADFVSRLGITQQQACKIKVSLSPPKKTGELTPQYGLSFCK